MMSSDVILDTASCLSSNPSSRPRPVIISYRIPDDTATQPITCDTGYDDTSPISSPHCFPPHRVVLRVGSRHDAIRPGYSFRLLARLVPSHRPISSANRLPPCGPSISSSHLPSRPASRSCFPPSVQHLLVSPDCPPHDTPGETPHDKSTTPHRMRRAMSRLYGARDGQSTTGKWNATTSDISTTTQMPLPARRIAHTSRMTHRHPHEHANRKTPPQRASQRL